MSVLLTAMAVGAALLSAVSMAIVLVLSTRALRRGADFEAELRAASFAFRIRMRPPTELRRGNESASSRSPAADD